MGAGRYKLFTSDVGLFVTLAFRDKNYTENEIYNKLLSDKLEAYLGYVYENVVAQMLVAKGYNFFIRKQKLTVKIAKDGKLTVRKKLQLKKPTVKITENGKLTVGKNNRNIFVFTTFIL